MYTRALFSIFFIFSLILQGQTLPDSQSREKPVGTSSTPTPEPLDPIYKPIQFSIFVWPSNSIMLGNSKVASIPRIFYDAPSGKPQIIPLSRNSNTPLYTYVGPQPLKLYDVDFEEIPVPEDAPPGTPPGQRLIKKTKIQVEIPDKFSRVMLVMIPGRTNPDGSILTLPLPYDTEVLRPGMARIYNTTKQMVALQFNDQDGPLLKLEANANIDFNPFEFADNRSVRVLGYIADKNGTPRRVHVSKMFFQPDKINMFLMYPQGARIRMLRLGTHEKPPEPTPTPDPEQLDPNAPQGRGSSGRQNRSNSW